MPNVSQVQGLNVIRNSSKNKYFTNNYARFFLTEWVERGMSLTSTHLSLFYSLGYRSRSLINRALVPCSVILHSPVAHLLVWTLKNSELEKKNSHVTALRIKAMPLNGSEVFARNFVWTAEEKKQISFTSNNFFFRNNSTKKTILNWNVSRSLVCRIKWSKYRYKYCFQL